MVQRYEQTRKLQWYKRGAAYFSLHRGLLLVFIEDTFILHRKVEELKTNTVCKY